MAWPTVTDVREKLGDAYATEPADTVIQSFLDRRIAQIKELTGSDFVNPETSEEVVPETVFKWVLNYTCADVIFRELTGKDAADVLDYSLGELKESKDPNVKLKLSLIEALVESAEIALKQYFMQQRNFYDYVSEVEEEYERSLIFRRSSP